MAHRLIRFIHRRIVLIPEEGRLPFALGLAVVFALVLTGISVFMYSATGASKLDLSRPGFEQERTEVRNNDSTKVYDTTSPITSESITDFLKEYDSKVKEVSEFGNFSDKALDESNLQLLTPTAE